ncbi:hypothetical protein TorRG33x02_337710, partial [Trema orientale]
RRPISRGPVSARFQGVHLRHRAGLGPPLGHTGWAGLFTPKTHYGRAACPF